MKYNLTPIKFNKEQFKQYAFSNFVINSKTNGHFIHFLRQKTIIAVIKEDYINQIKKHLLKRNVKIEEEITKIYNKEKHLKIYILLITYETQNNKLSACYLLKKYGIKEREKRRDLNMHFIMYGN